MALGTMALWLAGLKIAGDVAAYTLKEDNPELARNIATLFGSFTAGASSVDTLAGLFKSPTIGMGIADSGMAGALNKNPEGIFSGALPKGGNFDLPEDMMGGGFGLKMPKGWNTPKNKGLFDFTPQDTLQDQWNPGLAINW
tara:strand:+ start:45 stop:467 length:423 start_codon:yes stop_codon:yes gene_type:complete